jgi:murein L,D-transpeptidase YcbB/YkuD
MVSFDRRAFLALGAGLASGFGAVGASANGHRSRGPALDPVEREALGRFLAQTSAPLWHGSDLAARRLAALRLAIAEAERHGLEPEAYDPAGLQSGSANPEALEASASAAFLAFARDLGRGRPIPGLPPRPPEPFEEPQRLFERLMRAADPAAFFAGLAPATPRYVRLVTLLADLRAVAARGGWTRVPPVDGKIEPGQAHPAIVALRRRLAETDGFDGPFEGDRLDPLLAAALERFQARHGLLADGVLGRRTAAALAAPVEWRIIQTILALERLRRLPPNREPRWLLVDIAGFRLEAIDEPLPGREDVALESPIIVGTRYDQTPELTARAMAVTLNPYWHVPRSIAVKEILPDVRKDPGWLERNEMAVFDRAGQRVDPNAVDWWALGPGNFPYRLRQDWGPKNPLGRIKLEMPNRYDVYLHDTPRKDLFARTQRTFSHGCMRVARMHELAALLLAEQGWDLARIEAAIEESRGPRTIPLRTRPLVHVTYLGAVVDADGTVRFREDVYGRDARLARQLGLA